MRARWSSIPLPKRRPSLPAPRSAARPHLDPRSRSRRRAAVFGCGGTAFRSVRCGRWAGAAAASRGRPRSGAAVPKAGRGLSRLSGPSLKARAPGRSPALRGRPGRAPAVLRNLSGPLGVSETKGRARPRVLRPLGSVYTLAFPFFARTRARARDPRGPRGPRLVLGRPGVRLRSSRHAPNGPRASAFRRGEGSLNELQRPLLGPPS